MIRAMLVVALIFGAVTAATPASAQGVFPGSYPEGPVWIGDDLYWAEMRSDRVMRLAAGASVPEPFFIEAGCGPTAIASYRNHELIVLCHLTGSIAHIAADGTQIARIRAATDGTLLRNPNDASADANGGVWFTDPGRFSKHAPAEGRLYYLSADGNLTVQADGLAYGNGVFVDIDEDRLLMSEHLARRVLAYPLMAPGQIGASQTLFSIDDFDIQQPSLYPEAGPDGLEIGPEGTLWFAEYGATRLMGWRPEEGLVAALQVDMKYVTNIAFGPNGLAAMTGAYENAAPPYRGVTRVFPAQALLDTVQ
jgi:sugar lactone lactonase YvrE